MNKFTIAAFVLFITFLMSCFSNGDDGYEYSSSSFYYSSSSSSIKYSSSSSYSSSRQSSSSEWINGIVYGEDIIDERDSLNPQTYKTVVIGEQTWMARNLNYNVELSKCYEDEPTNCDMYGRLYDWATAMNISQSYNSSHTDMYSRPRKGICPNGWHLPSDDEFRILVRYVANQGNAGTILKATSGWNRANGTDYYGFSALPGGNGYSNGSFSPYYLLIARWWTSTENFTTISYNAAYMYYIEYDPIDEISDTDILSLSKKNFYSVRCVKNSEETIEN